jgi:predicted permease
MAAGWVSVNLFPILGVEPILGRGFAPDEGVPGGPNVAILSHAVWQQNFGGDREVIERSVDVDGTPFTVIGVMPPDFRIWVDSDLWMPMRLGEGFASDRRYQNFVMVGRLAPDVLLEQAQVQVDGVATNLAMEYPVTNSDKGFLLTDLQEALTQSYGSTLILLMGSVALLLLIACGNIAALLLARGFARRRELSVRTALGASGPRIFGNLLAESLLIALSGGILGTLVAVWSHDLVFAYLPFDLPGGRPPALSLPMLAAALLLSVGTGVLIGIFPARRAARRDVVDGLKTGAGAMDLRGTRLRSTLVMAQVALSVVLLVGSGLLLRSFMNLRSVELGFDPESLLAADVELPRSGYPDRESRIQFVSGLEERVRAIPGVVDVAIVNRLPVRMVGGNTYVYPEGEPPPADERPRTANERWVMPGYFRAMGMQVLRGRGIEASDGADGAPVLVINERMAEVFFPGEDPIGRRLVIDYDEGTVLEVVGVVTDARFDGPAHETFQAMYRSYLQEPVTRIAMAVRVAGDPESVAQALRAAVRGLDPDLPISDMEMMDRVIARTFGDQTLTATLVSTLAWIALLLTALGIYGVLAYYVSQRTPELGLRIALGAETRDLARLVAVRGLTLMGVGIALGLGASYAATRLLSRLLVGVGPTDPGTFLLVGVFFLMVGSLACVLPARRALKVDPVVALQAE